MTLVKTIPDPKYSDLINAIQDLLHKSESSPEVRQLAVEIVVGQPDMIGAIYDWVKNHVQYIADPTDIEMLTSPIRMVLNYREGLLLAEDCDGHALLVTALLRSVGYDAHVILIDQENDGWSHAYTAIKLQDGSWLNVDTSTSLYPLGWEPHYYQRMVI